MVFTRQPESWREWWAAIRTSTADWYSIPAGEVRGHDPLVAEVEREIGMTISPSVHEWAAYAADLKRAGVFQRAMRDHFALKWVPDIDALRILSISEGDLDWVIQRGYLRHEDPPVEARCIDIENGELLGTWQHTATTSEFALQQLLAYRRPSGGSFGVDMTVTPELLEQIRSAGHISLQLGRETLIEGDDLLIVAGVSPYSLPEGRDSIEVQVGASRVGRLPQVLTELAEGKRAWSTGAFCPDPRPGSCGEGELAPF